MSLISISGKIANGKDTVADIIQYLVYCDQHKGDRSFYYPVDVWMDELKDGYLRVNPLETGWEIRRFADKLKDIVCLLIGCTREQLEDREFKENPLGPEWDFYEGFGSVTNRRHISLTEDFDGSHSVTDVQKKQMTPRLILQLLGTEAGRQILHPQIWVNSLFADYGKGSQWIITDCRFPNELEAVEQRGGITIRVNRPSIVRPENEHASETSLDSAFFKYAIENDGTIEELVGNVKDILLKEGVIC